MTQLKLNLYSCKTGLSNSKEKEKEKYKYLLSLEDSSSDKFDQFVYSDFKCVQSIHSTTVQY